MHSSAGPRWFDRKGPEGLCGAALLYGRRQAAPPCAPVCRRHVWLQPRPCAVQKCESVVDTCHSSRWCLLLPRVSGKCVTGPACLLSPLLGGAWPTTLTSLPCMLLPIQESLQLARSHAERSQFLHYVTAAQGLDATDSCQPQQGLTCHLIPHDPSWLPPLQGCRANQGRAWHPSSCASAALCCTEG